MLYRLYFIGKKVVLFRRFFHCCRVLYFVLPGYCFAPPVKSSTFARNENVFCMNKIGAVLCICVLLLSGCGGKDNEFVVEGTINNLGGRPIYAVYSLENGIVVDTLRPQNGFITFKNSASAVIPIQFYYFDKTPLTKLAGMAHNGYARAIRPVHTTADGDSIYALSLGDVPGDINVVGAMAALAMERAILRAVQSAGSAYGLIGWEDLPR